MKNQQLFISVILFVYLIQIHCIVTRHWNKIRPKNENLSQTNLLFNCSIVKNDEDVVRFKDFIIPLNPFNSNSKSYGATYENGHIFHLNIIKEKFIPSTIFCLKYLKRLDIQNTCFSPCNHPQIPSLIEYFASSLTEFRIYDTKITHLPNEIGKLIHLQTLTLSNTGLMSLPDTIGNLRSLNSLILSDNSLTYLPVTIRNLRSLQQITLTNNPYLHSVEPLNGHLSLKILDTRYCPIEILPQNLPKLTDLYMMNNSLTNLTGIETLGNGTKSKKSFYFDMNSIEFVPHRIQQVKNLFRLKLDHNKLNNLPTNIFNIITLSYLNIQNNHFRSQDLKILVSQFHATNPNLTFII